MGTDGMQRFLRQLPFQDGRCLKAVPFRTGLCLRIVQVMQKAGYAPQFLILAKVLCQFFHHSLAGKGVLQKMGFDAMGVQQLKCFFAGNHRDFSSGFRG